MQIWSIKQVAKRLHRDDHGSVLVLVALMVVVLCGFTALVTDVGALYVQKQQAQDGADAGALAGADLLINNAASAANEAYQIATGNDGHVSYSATSDTATDTVTVSGGQTVSLWFARALGDSSASLSVHSIAQVGTLISAVGIVPIAVPNQTFTYGEEVYLSDGAGSGLSGNYGFLDFSGEGSKGVETDIEHGYDFPLTVGQQVLTETGVMSGPVSDAINYRLQQAASDPGCQSFETARSDCANVMYLPVVDSLAVSGKKSVTILGFAAFYLEGLTGEGGHQQILGRFIQRVRPGEMGPGTNYGTYGVRLLG
ncbi:pilus assembly protein TadG-related protein [Alicyclobacillus tolerans]|uniref:pilus assembly protein TadG-related protein n=1 Tax=Alicyclobacillus tolerans TaxID=90970 RepID=UPI001F3AEE79|nr:pilus assembly protein TadG-related protein [Alicyclobacillus tolerans]MCF8563833.1 pilus assembly protein TadG-related protein [Alicyclobacillus tolerans]